MKVSAFPIQSLYKEKKGRRINRNPRNRYIMSRWIYLAVMPNFSNERFLIRMWQAGAAIQRKGVGKARGTKTIIKTRTPYKSMDSIMKRSFISLLSMVFLGNIF